MGRSSSYLEHRLVSSTSSQRFGRAHRTREVSQSWEKWSDFRSQPARNQKHGNSGRARHLPIRTGRAQPTSVLRLRLRSGGMGLRWWLLPLL